MKAGKTETVVGTLVRVTSVTSRDPEDQAMACVVGQATHPFPGLVLGSATGYLIGLHLDDENAAKANAMRSRVGGGSANLLRGDTYEEVSADDDGDGDGT